MSEKIRIHFMGIGGSAASGVAIMAKEAGFVVDGCDLEEDTAYLSKVRKLGIKVFKGHSESHIKDVDILAASPAIVFLNKSHPEYLCAKKRNIFMTWDELVGKYLLDDKEVICITGTHGKSTTTSLAALLFEKAGLNPSALVGAKLKEWGGNYRVGRSKYFIIEADDFYNKFLNYHPSTIILNNFEYDHPDFFKNEKQMLTSYLKFINLLRGPRNLIINQDSIGNKKLISLIDSSFLESVNLWGYTLEDNPLIFLKNSIRGKIIKMDEGGSSFEIESNLLKKPEEYRLKIPGRHNISNALGVICLGKIYKIRYLTIYKALSEFSGTVRRLELIGEKRGVKVYDDYAHHPTAIRETLLAVRQRHPRERVWVVVEPHSYSRTKALLKEYRGVFDSAEKVIIGPIYKARDLKDFGVSGNLIVKASHHKDIKFVSDPSEISGILKTQTKRSDVVVVMGAGYSYKWARDILQKLG